MKKIFLPVLGSILLFTACKEKPPIDFNSLKTDTSLVVLTVDTTYADVVPTAQSRNVLIEDFTGASCSNCPAGHEILNSLSDQYPGRLNILGLHINNFSQSAPYAGAKYDFRTAEGTDIGTNIYGGINQMPIAGIDRALYSNALLIDKNSWAGAVTSRMATSAGINLEVSSHYDNTNMKDTITVKVTYLQNTSDQQNLSIAIVEDSLKDIQEYPPFSSEFPSGADTAYIFNDVLRDFVTKPASYGEVLLAAMAQKEAGRVVVRTYVYNLSHAPNQIWFPQNCRIVAFITNGNTQQSKEVLQSASCKL